jgi:hypothetical protein
MAPLILNLGFDGSELSALRHGLLTRERTPIPIDNELEFLVPWNNKLPLTN